MQIYPTRRRGVDAPLRARFSRFPANAFNKQCEDSCLTSLRLAMSVAASVCDTTALPAAVCLEHNRPRLWHHPFLV